MVPDEESKAEATQPDNPAPRGNPRGERRPGRGRRGRGRGRRPKQAQSESRDLPEPQTAVARGEPEPIFELAAEPREELDPKAGAIEAAETVSEPEAIVPELTGKSGQP